MSGMSRDASLELLEGIDNLRNALRTLVEIVIKLYITSWYASISPRDQTFVSAVRKTTLACLDSVIDDLTETQERRKDAQDRLQEFIFTTAPTIVERHIKAYRQAKDDTAMMQLGTAPPETPARAVPVSRDSAQPRLSETSMLVLPQRYHVYASHPGIRIMESSMGNMEGSAPMTPTQTDPVEIRRPPKLLGIDESLADALSSSITALPPRNAQGEVPLSISGKSREVDSEFHPYGFSHTQSYEPSPQYLSVLVDHFLRKHLPEQDYASDAERTMVTEVLGNAVLGNVLRKCSEPWFIWRTGLNLIRDDRLPEGANPESMLESDLGPRQGSGSLTASSTSATPGNPTTTPVTPYLTLLNRIMSIVVAACVYLAATITNRLLLAFQTDLPSTAVKAREKRKANYLFEPWIEASIAWTSGGSAFGTREFWTASKMLYIASRETVDGTAQGIVPNFPDVNSATWIVRKFTDTLFPDGVLAPTIPDPSAEEAETMRQDLERCVYDRIPAIARFLLLGTSEIAQRRTITNMLDVFSNPSANANLMLTLVEAALNALVPRSTNAERDENRSGQTQRMHLYNSMDTS